MRKDFEKVLEKFYHAQLSVIWEKSGSFNKDIKELNNYVQSLADKHGITIDYLEEVIEEES